MTQLIVKTYIHEGLGMLFGWKGEEDGAEIHQYGILCLDAACQKDLDAFGTVTITADTPSVYDAVRSTARRMGLDLTEEDLEWADDRISCWQ